MTVALCIIIFFLSLITGFLSGLIFPRVKRGLFPAIYGKHCTQKEKSLNELNKEYLDFLNYNGSDI